MKELCEKSHLVPTHTCGLLRTWLEGAKTKTSIYTRTKASTRKWSNPIEIIKLLFFWMLVVCLALCWVLGSCTHSWHLEGDSTVYMRQMSHGIVSWMSCCSVTKLCWTLFDPMNCSTLGLRVLHYLPEFAQTYVHWVGDAIQPSHPLSPLLLLPSIFPSIRVIYNESVLHIKWPKYWSFSISPYNEYARLISFKIDWFDLLAFEYRSKG